MWVLEELGSCWQAGRQLALATKHRPWTEVWRQLFGSACKVLAKGLTPASPPAASWAEWWAGRTGEPNAAILIR